MTADNIGMGESGEQALEEAKRPVAIARHQEVMRDMEESLSDMLITGNTDHPRLKRMIEELETPSEQARIKSTITALSDQSLYRDHILQDALIEHLCVMREERGIEVATLQLHVMGIYRFVRSMMDQQQFLLPGIDDLRALPAANILKLTQPQEYTFGSAVLAQSLVYSPTQAREVFKTIRELNNLDPRSPSWGDDTGEPTLSRREEEPLAVLDPEEREDARRSLIRAKIRPKFYRAVFLEYFHIDELSGEEIEAHRTVLHWLQSIMETLHMYPFMQGQSVEQKHFRIRQILRKIIQINEIYQRVERAGSDPQYADRFDGLSTTQKLQLLSQGRYPMLDVDGTFTISTMLCPFSAFAKWVQHKVTSKDFVIPPDPKSK